MKEEEEELTVKKRLLSRLIKPYCRYFSHTNLVLLMHSNVTLSTNNRMQRNSWVTMLCSRSFWYSRSLGLLAPVIHGMITYIHEPLEIGWRG